MADLSWLTEAVNKTRSAQLAQQKMVAIPLFNQIGQSLQNMQSPVTPQVQQLFQMIEQRQRQNPVYIPFKAGTPTLAKQQFTESTRQWGQEFAENKRRWEQEFAAQEQQRRIENALRQRQLALQEKSASSSGFGPETAGERHDYYYGQIYSRYQKALDDLWSAKGVKDSSGNYTQGPSAEDVSETLYAIEKDMVKKAPLMMQIGLTPKEISDIFNSQVANGLGAQGATIYNQWKKSKNISLDINSSLGVTSGSNTGTLNFNVR